MGKGGLRGDLHKLRRWSVIVISDVLVPKRADLGASIDSPGRMSPKLQVVSRTRVLERTVLEKSI